MKSEKGIILSSGISEFEIDNTFNSIRESKGIFEIYDSFYPSPSDPGAYICYANYDYRTNTWEMTLGNHGWSGGIYRVENNVIVNQLLHLSSVENKIELITKELVFFSHYDTESVEKNAEMNLMLAKIHGK